MDPPLLPNLTRFRRLALLALVAALPGLLAPTCAPSGGVGSRVLFESPAGTPVALGLDGRFLVSANTLDASIAIVDLAAPDRPTIVPVGLEPVSVAVRPKKVLGGLRGPDQWLFVVNHVSDSISIVSLAEGQVKQTLQVVVDGVTRTNEPVGIVFDGPDRAFVTLDEANQVIRLEPVDPARPDGDWHVASGRLQLFAQAPRAIAIQGRRLLVAAFESGNRTVFPACGPVVLCEGCQEFPECQFELPHAGVLGGAGTVSRPIVRDPLALDRDLWVFDLDDLDSGEPLQIVEDVGTLLYGMATTADGRVFVTNTEARNDLNGLDALANRMFDNRLSLLDCASGTCGLVDRRDLEQAGRRVPTPYAVAASADGALVVVTAAGSDGAPQVDALGDPVANDGLFVLDRDGAVLGSVAVGPIPQGVVLGEGPAGGLIAYVWSGQDYAVRVVDLSDPAAPSVVGVLLDDPALRLDPLPRAVSEGRLVFRSARGSTSGTFSCESCHPNAGTDQLLWTINSREDVVVVDGRAQPDADGVVPDPRTTMPVRGLRDTLPLHWDGALGNPHASGSGCVLSHQSAETTETCFRDLVDASLGAVMCDPFDCPTTEGLPGAYGDRLRRGMAAYMASVSVSPGPDRAEDDALSDAALSGVEAINAIGCSRLECHSLPLHVSPVIGPSLGTNPPTLRGLWDRHLLASNGVFGGRAAMEFSNAFVPQLGNIPFPTHQNYVEQRGIDENSALNAFLTYIFLGFGRDVVMNYSREIGVGYAGILGRQVSLSGPALPFATAPVPDPADLAALYAIEGAVRDGKVRAHAHGTLLDGSSLSLEYEAGPCGEDEEDDAEESEVPCGDFAWRAPLVDDDLDFALVFSDLPTALEGLLFFGATMTVRAGPPAGLRLPATGFPTDADRMPLLWSYFNLGPQPSQRPIVPDASGTVQLLGRYVSPDAAVFLDGRRCDACAITVDPDPALDPRLLALQQPVFIRKQLPDGRIVDNVPDAIDVALSGLPAPGSRPFVMLQVQNPLGYVSNEVPITLGDSSGP